MTDTTREALAAALAALEAPENPGLDRPTEFAIAQARGFKIGNARRILLSALATTEQAPAALTVPKGWKLVPVEPTQQMLREASAAYKRVAPSLAGSPWAEVRAYQALLSAAPSVPEQAEQPAGDRQRLSPRDAVYQALRLAELLAGSVAMSNVASANAYSSALRAHLMTYIVDAPAGEQAEQPAVAKHDAVCLWEGTAIRSASDIVNCSCVTPTAPAEPPSAQGREARFTWTGDSDIDEAMLLLGRIDAPDDQGRLDQLETIITRLAARLGLSGAQGGGV